MLNNIRNFFYDFKEYVVVIILLLISLSLLSINEKPQIKKVRTLALGGFAVFNSISSSVKDVFSGSGELDELKKINAELMLKINQLREFGLENNELRQMLNFQDSTTFDLQPAKIISKLVSKVQGNFIINVGSGDSIAVGMPVINSDGLVGMITEVSTDYSLVKTILNSELKLAAKNQRSRIDGMLNWTGSELVMKNIPTNFDSKIGDRIITSEFSTIFPPSIPVGVISKKETNISGLLSNLVIQPFADFTLLKNIFVLKIIESEEINELELNLLGNRQ